MKDNRRDARDVFGPHAGCTLHKFCEILIDLTSVATRDGGREGKKHTNSSKNLRVISNTATITV